MSEQSRNVYAPRRAFTLVELLVVIGIIALLISILLPTLSTARKSGYRTQCMSNLRQLGVAVSMYTLDNKGAYPAANDPISAPSPLIWFWMGRGFRPALEQYAKRSGENPGVFLCPQDPNRKETFDNTSYAYSLAFYRSPELINTLSTTNDNYSLNNNFSLAHPTTVQKVGKVKFPTQKIMLGEWLSAHGKPSGTTQGWFTKVGTRLFLFADQHVEYLDWTQIIPARDGNPNPNLTIDGIRGRDVR